MSRCLIVAGPNGAGKTTFARDFLPRDSVRRFINTDLIAAGLSPLDPSTAQLTAGRIFLAELDRVSAGGGDLAFESTLSGLTYLPRLRRWKAAGYTIEIIYLKLDDVRISLQRIAARVREGLAFEKAYAEVTATLMAHLKGKPECRDLYQELLNSQQQQHIQVQVSRNPGDHSRAP